MQNENQVVPNDSEAKITVESFAVLIFRDGEAVDWAGIYDSTEEAIYSAEEQNESESAAGRISMCAVVPVLNYFTSEV